MFILEEPYVSPELINTLVKNNYPVITNEKSREIAKNNPLNLVSDEIAIKHLQTNNKVYTCSETALEWLYKNSFDQKRIDKIKNVKNKVAFRKMIKSIYPDFYFKEVEIDELRNVDLTKIPFPCVLKPAVGFFSAGVYTILNKKDWLVVVKDIEENFADWSKAYSKSVIGQNTFIIEEYITGTELAIDGYYDNDGKPVVLDILQHDFSSDTDVSDRAYFTSKKIIEKYLDSTTLLLTKMNKIMELDNFPFHLELRVNEEHFIPIELNPMRFAGWCCTDMGLFAYGINNYEYFMNNLKPDFKTLLKGKDNIVYSMFVLDKPKDFDFTKEKFDYEKLTNYLSDPMKVRKIDYNKHPVFGFAFTKTDQSNEVEREFMLKTDFRDFILNR